MKIVIRLLSVILTICLFIPVVNVSSTETQRLLGDANNDGIVTISDVTALQRHIAQSETLDFESQAAGDVDASGNLNITDATTIQRFLAEMDVAYQINEPLSLYEKESSAALSALKNRLAQTKAAAGGKPVLICSYDTDDIHLSNSAYTYDNALAAMAFISAGDKDDAETILDAFVYVTEHDRYKPGRIRNAYAADTVYYYNGGDSVKLPGWWNASAGRWEEDQTQVGCNTDNTSYAALALLQYDKAYGSDKYLTTAKTLMDWVLDECSDSTDGFASGFERWPENGDVTVLNYKSTENNIDAYAAFKQLYAVTGEQKYKDAADSALRFIESMYDSKKGLFYVGTLDDGSTNKSIIALDAQIWSAMALGDEFAPYTDALEIADGMKLPGGGYPFYTVNANGGWWAEGTAFTALMLRERNEYEKNIAAMNALCSIRLDSGLFPAATVDYLLTGLSWEYSTDPCIAPTAWFVLAANGFDPYLYN